MSSSLLQSSVWKALHQHQHALRDTRLECLFSQSAARVRDFSLSAAGIHLDYSKNLITADSMKLFEDLARQQGFDEARLALLSGERVNNTEQRPALHMALRDSLLSSKWVDGVDIAHEIKQTQAQMRQFVECLHQG